MSKEIHVRAVVKEDEKVQQVILITLLLRLLFTSLTL
jgi:hypothetical protein